MCHTGGELLFGQVPMLEVDGLKLVQTNAIVRHLARTYPGLCNNAPSQDLARYTQHAPSASSHSCIYVYVYVYIYMYVELYICN